jgi:hypothetical protein
MLSNAPVCVLHADLRVPQWTFAFTAAIVFGTVVMHGPRSPLAPAASTELEQAYDLFSRASKHSPRAAKALVRSGSPQFRTHVPPS